MSWIIRRKIDMSKFDDNNKEHQKIGSLGTHADREYSNKPWIYLGPNQYHTEFAFTEADGPIGPIGGWNFHKDWTIPVCPLEEALLCPDL